MKSLLIFAAVLVVAYGQRKDGNAMDLINEINAKAAKKGTSSFGAGKAELFEGDIVMTNKLRRFLKHEKAGKTSPFDAIVNGAWPRKTVYYSMRRLPSNVRSVVRQAVAEYHAKTCIKFIESTGSGSYLDFFQGGGCYSMIGRQGGRQTVSLGRGCEHKGVAIHEIMHALGFFHEQSRRDRDSYITIHWQNIPQRVRYNFEKYRHGQANTLGEPYDKSSVMHYGNYAFSNNGQRTISSKSNPRETLGQRRGLSKIDVRQLNKYYKCSGTTKPVATSRPPTTNCKDVYSLCPKMAQVGLCKVGVAWVPNNCQKSCKKCPVVPSKPKCTYTSSSNYCAGWARANYCKSRQYGNWMGKHCYQCGKCTRR